MRAFATDHALHAESNGLRGGRGSVLALHVGLPSKRRQTVGVCRRRSQVEQTLPFSSRATLRLARVKTPSSSSAHRATALLFMFKHKYLSQNMKVFVSDNRTLVVKRFQPLFDAFPVWEELVEFRIKCSVVARVFDMAHLMRNHIVDTNRRRSDQFGVEC